ncbi:hypothetical protein ACFQY5_20800 [Paeniroseomonas aquatica]|uniref:hypothetical protein n=1 Tax=Paeniroseomonas aquatica TaxID=373043 RepID=UPI003605E215
MSEHDGHFVWHELMTTDLPAAEAFYRAVIGWEAEALHHLDVPYTRLGLGGRPMAGMMELPEAAGPWARGPAGSAMWRSARSMSPRPWRRTSAASCMWRRGTFRGSAASRCSAIRRGRSSRSSPPPSP